MLDYHDENYRYSSGSLGHVYTTLFILRRYSASEYVVGKLKKTKKKQCKFCCSVGLSTLSDIFKILTLHSMS